MASENTGGHAHDVASWFESRMRAFDEDDQAMLGRIVVMLTATYAERVGTTQVDVKRPGAYNARDLVGLTHTQKWFPLLPTRDPVVADHGLFDTQVVDHVPSLLGHHRMSVHQDDMLMYISPSTGRVMALDTDLEAIQDTLSAYFDSIVGAKRRNEEEADLAEIMSLDEAEAQLDAYTQSSPANETDSGQMLSAIEMAYYLGATRQTIGNRYKQGRIIGLTREVGGRVYPKAQFSDHVTPREPCWLPGLERVVATFGNGWRCWIWLTNPRDDLNHDMPLSRLRLGDTNAVLAALERDHDGAFG